MALAVVTRNKKLCCGHLFRSLPSIPLEEHASTNYNIAATPAAKAPSTIIPFEMALLGAILPVLLAVAAEPVALPRDDPRRGA